VAPAAERRKPHPHEVMRKWKLADSRRFFDRPSRKALENNTTFDMNRRFIPNHAVYPALQAFSRRIVSELGGEGVPAGFRSPIAHGGQREQVSWRTAETLVSNILHLSTVKRESLAIPLSPGRYSKSNLSGSGIINLVKLGHERKLWFLKPGFRYRDKQRLARLVPLRKFWALQREVLAEGIGGGDIAYSEPTKLIILRNDKGEEIPSERWKQNGRIRDKIRRLETTLENVNGLLANFTISSPARRLYPVLYAIFNVDFQHGGRFYTRHGGHTNLPRAERLSITFAPPDGQPLPSVELDYDGLHLRILYDLAGKRFPHAEDPYGRVLSVLGLDSTAIFCKHPSIREDLKRLLLAFINGTATSAEQIARANFRLFYGKTESQREKAAERIERWRKVGLLRATADGRPSAAHVVKAFGQAHKVIRDRFSTGCGLHLQNLDAAMALFILERLNGHRVPVLPIHDSFIVPEPNERRLKTTMRDAYRVVMQEQTGLDSSFTIPISRKRTEQV
jgi:hypothetical protein